MHEDGEAMYAHDHEIAEPRRRGDAQRAARDAAWEGARRAAATGRADSIQPAAVLRLQRLAGNSGVGSLVEQENEGATSPVLDIVGKATGSPLPTSLRVQMESHLGADFGNVRVHDDGAAAASAQAVNAKAYTVGNDLVFNKGAYEPGTAEGQHTLAHELTHVVQQRSGPVDGTPTGDGIAVSDPHDRFEQEAEATAAAVQTLDASAPASAGAEAHVQRQEPEEEDAPVEAMALQRETMPEEEPEESVQAMAVQRQTPEEEEEPEGPVQMIALQREEMGDEEHESL